MGWVYHDHSDTANGLEDDDLTGFVNPLVPCGECGASMVLKAAKVGKRRYFYSCTRFPECRGTHAAHDDGRPMGFPANKETRQARREAHEALDSLWLNSRQRRGARRRVYRLCAEHFGVKEIHIAASDAEQCRKIIQWVMETEETF